MSNTLVYVIKEVKILNYFFNYFNLLDVIVDYL